MKKINQIKDELQNNAINLIDTNSRIFLQWATGAGKSKAAIGMINKLCDREFHDEQSELTVLLVIAERAHRKNWQDEFLKWGVNTDKVEIVCYASLRKYKDTRWGFIIYDEAHHLTSDKRLEYASTIQSDNVLLLSASLQEKSLSLIEGIYGKFLKTSLTLDDAIKDEILPEPKIFLMALELDNTRESETYVLNRGDKKKAVRVHCSMAGRWKYLMDKRSYPDLELIMSCTEKQKYDMLDANVTYYKTKYQKCGTARNLNLWMMQGSARKKFLGEMKTEYANNLIKNLMKEKKRFICFCASIKQAEYLGKKNSIHSKKDVNNVIIEKFNKNKIDSIFAVGMLQEGQNLNNIQAGVIIQLDGQERSFIQKFGRTLRAEDPVEYIFYVKGTQDEQYLKNVINGIDEKFIEIIDIMNS